MPVRFKVSPAASDVLLMKGHMENAYQYYVHPSFMSEQARLHRVRWSILAFFFGLVLGSISWLPPYPSTGQVSKVPEVSPAARALVALSPDPSCDEVDKLQAGSACSVGFSNFNGIKALLPLPDLDQDPDELEKRLLSAASIHTCEAK